MRDVGEDSYGAAQSCWAVKHRTMRTGTQCRLSLPANLARYSPSLLFPDGLQSNGKFAQLFERVLEPIDNRGQNSNHEYHERHNHHSRDPKSSYAHGVREVWIRLSGLLKSMSW
jgi:hypothetical protein